VKSQINDLCDGLEFFIKYNYRYCKLIKAEKTCQTKGFQVDRTLLYSTLRYMVTFKDYVHFKVDIVCNISMGESFRMPKYSITYSIQ